MGDKLIDRTPVTSSMAKAVAHDPERNELHVEFHNGRVTIIENVTPEEAAEALEAPSFGKHFNGRLRGKPSRPFSDIPDPE